MSQSGSVRRRNAKWQARYRSPGRRERSKTFDRKVDAERWLRGQVTDLERGAYIDPARSKITVAAWADRWFNSLPQSLKPKTRAGYESLLTTKVLPRFGDLALASVDHVEIQEWVSDLEGQGLSASRIGQAYRVLSMLYKSAVASRFVLMNPAVGVRVPRMARNEIRVLRVRDVDRLAAAVENRSPEGRREEYATLIITAAHTGMRWGELAALRTDRLNRFDGTIRVVESVSEVGGSIEFGDTKTHRARTIPPPSRVMTRLENLVYGRGADELVFRAPRGGVLRHSNFMGRVFRPAVADSGLGDLDFHHLRHTSVSQMIAEGINPRRIMEHHGHSSIRVTYDLYGHLFEGDDADLAERMDRRIEAESADGDVIDLKR